jgi:hypothetical protein
VSADLPSGETLRRVEPDGAGTLRVEAVFRIADEQHAQTVAAKMIDRVHEIANLPECECDVDVNVQVASDDDGARTGLAR